MAATSAYCLEASVLLFPKIIDSKPFLELLIILKTKDDKAVQYSEQLCAFTLLQHLLLLFSCLPADNKELDFPS